MLITLSLQIRGRDHLLEPLDDNFEERANQAMVEKLLVGKLELKKLSANRNIRAFRFFLSKLYFYRRQ